MADVFISYAHEDQAFVRRIVPALEAEGFSVWWDHTIPPGKSWDTFIAKGIEEARCCIVVWSTHSVASDWVKEEATLAKTGEKYLPVAISDDQPPVGFRRIQAANLKGWSGDTENAQWRLLVQEARSTVGQSHAPAAGRAHDVKASRGGKRAPLGLILGGVVCAVLLAAAAVFLTRGPSEAPLETSVATEAIEEPAPIVQAPVVEDSAPATSGNDAELERLRRERDQALETARNQQAENERLQRERQQAPAPTEVSVSGIAGYWAGEVSWLGPGQGWTLGAQVFNREPSQAYEWRIEGDRVVWMDCCGNRFDGRVSGDTMTGTTTGPNGPGTFRITRPRRD